MKLLKLGFSGQSRAFEHELMCMLDSRYFFCFSSLIIICLEVFINSTSEELHLSIMELGF